MFIIKKCFENKVCIFLKNDENTIGEIYSIIDKNTCIIVSMIIKEEWRGQGYGTLLLKNIIEYCKECNINKIELDDMSDNFNKKNNIYVKNGFKYIQKGYPEMVLYL